MTNSLAHIFLGVIAILELEKKFKRVLYIDLDIHHGVVFVIFLQVLISFLLMVTFLRRWGRECLCVQPQSVYAFYT